MSGVHKQVKTPGFARQRAGPAPAYDHAIALLGGVQHFLLDQPIHPFTIEDLVIRQRGRGIKLVLPEDLAVAVVPGIEPVVELRCHLFRNAGGARRGRQQFRIQQPPPQPLGEIMGKFTAPRSVLAFNSDNTDR